LEWASAIKQAAELDVNQRSKMSADIKASISTDLIDEQYRKLLEAVSESNYDQQIDVSQILGS